MVSYQIDPRVSVEPFQSWHRLVVGTAAHRTATGGNDMTLAEQTISQTDFPAPGVQFYVVDGTVMLLSEY